MLSECEKVCMTDKKTANLFEFYESNKSYTKSKNLSYSMNTDWIE